MRLMRKGVSTPAMSRVTTRRWRCKKGQPRRSREAVLRKVRKLQRVIPGGQRVQQIDHLFLRTADYILHLRLQINLLQTLFKLYSSYI
ncbi:uncharacterized protein LOC110694527 [Chenopodium quinoa]|uniref:Uncharacterized protein n=1 Tax=Chenopodium quinoa TaxID=63459 RepID=A0A803LJ43_CHEQI|nr:uncharacterized protein LOC110694527 [Chenopodium quinoa]